ncbi:Hypothetical predicted protein [Olea europaea subsp. europaea]|uniref:Uncharacterized protein n=1 Tax=Olea europaea subsp. europaea TaxID=158383 RepID=A0A8S0QXD2_OLEEU|nr:Hypothetical predicted protein [Olea europaea subsp. europaea]
MATNKEHREQLKIDLNLFRDSLKNFRVEMQVQIRGMEEKLVEVINSLVGMKASMEQSSFYTSEKGTNALKLTHSIQQSIQRYMEIVEYEKDDKNTKVSISPQETTNFKGKLFENMEDAKEKINEEGIHHRFSPRELVCDAYGKFKHKIVRDIGKTKDTLSDKAHEVE